MNYVVHLVFLNYPYLKKLIKVLENKENFFFLFMKPFILPEDPAFSTRNKYRVLFFSAVFVAGTIDILGFFFSKIEARFHEFSTGL